MRRRGCFGLIGIFVLLLSLQIAERSEAAGPKMVLPQKEADYKEIKEGEVLEHTFEVLNQGDQVLEIRNVRPG